MGFVHSFEYRQVRAKISFHGGHVLFVGHGQLDESDQPSPGLGVYEVDAGSGVFPDRSYELGHLAIRELVSD